MILYLVATHIDGYMNVYLNKCKKENINYKILGFGEKWKGYAWKFNQMYEELVKLDPNEIVVFTDAYDVILLTDENTILQKFREMDTPILLSIEDNPTTPLHDYLYKKMFPKVLNKYYINSGLYMGYVWALKKLFYNLKNQYNLQDSDDDQKTLANFLNDNTDFTKKFCKFDDKNKVFLNVLKKKYRGDLNKLDCCFVHGPANTDLKNIINHFNLHGDMIFKKRNPVVYYKNIIKNYSKYYKTEIFILVLILGILLYLFIKRKNKIDKV